MPTQYILTLMPWQEVFLWFSGVTVLVAGFLWRCAMDHPEDTSGGKESFLAAFRGFRVVLCNPVFIAFGPLSIVGQGVWLAYQGLWAGAWLREVNGLPPFMAAWFLLALAVCVIFGNLFMGAVAGRLSMRGIPVLRFSFWLCVCFVLAQAAIWSNAFGFSAYLWGVFGILVSGSIMFYAVLSTSVPAEYAGRAVSLLNLFATLAGFVIQYAVGGIINMWEPESTGVYPVDAHQTASGLVIAVQMLAVFWFVWRWRSQKPVV